VSLDALRPGRPNAAPAALTAQVLGRAALAGLVRRADERRSLRLVEFLRFRNRARLNRPYGPKAEARGLTVVASPEEESLPSPGDRDDLPF
jgi:hypothetical protein